MTTIMVLIMVTLASIFFMAADTAIGTLVKYVLSLGQ